MAPSFIQKGGVVLPVNEVLTALPADPVIVNMSVNGKHHADSFNISASAIYNLCDELECVRDSFLKEALAKKIDLSLSIEEELPVAFWDIEGLRVHVFNNILSNAIRYTPVGGTISISVKLHDNYKIIIQISDTGSGTPATVVESIFRNYQKLDKNNNNSCEGGLIKALICIHAHKGTLGIVADPKFSGATFKTSIPLYDLCFQ